jgi:hypothetical protein
VQQKAEPDVLVGLRERNVIKPDGRGLHLSSGGRDRRDESSED